MQVEVVKYDLGHAVLSRRRLINSYLSADHDALRVPYQMQ